MKTRLLTESEINEAMQNMTARKSQNIPMPHRLFVGMIIGISIGAVVAIFAGVVIERVNYERTNPVHVWQ